ncbi:MAG: hypothetical protein ABI791_13525 [Acidobacteriota bacterium]
MKKARIFTLFLIIFAPIVVSAQRLSPRSTVEAFYKFDRSHPQTFSRRNIDARKRWFSAPLYRMFLNELRLESAYLKKHPDDKAFFGDGLPFSPYEESCGVAGRSYSSKYNVGRTTMTRNAADVTITVSWPDPCKLAPDRYRVRLVLERSVWKVDDIIYSDGRTLAQDIRAHRY